MPVGKPGDVLPVRARTHTGSGWALRYLPMSTALSCGLVSYEQGLSIGMGSIYPAWMVLATGRCRCNCLKGLETLVAPRLEARTQKGVCFYKRLAFAGRDAVVSL